MDFSIAGNNFLTFSVLVFVSVLLLIEGLYSLWRAHKGPQASRLRRRLQSLAASFRPHRPNPTIEATPAERNPGT